MNAHLSAILLGVRDMDRAKQFYKDLGWPIQVDTPQYVSFTPRSGSSTVGLYPWDALAQDAGVASQGSGFRGVTLHYIVRSEDRVAEVLAEAERAGGKIARPMQKQPWGTSGYFADPDGYLWKVAYGQGPQPYAE